MTFEHPGERGPDALANRHVTSRDGAEGIIKCLPPETIAQIRSTAIINDLSGVVVQLLKNSLDAGSTTVDIAVDFHRGNCLVEDNGAGILPSEFEEGGGLGKLYCELSNPFCRHSINLARYF